MEMAPTETCHEINAGLVLTGNGSYRICQL